VVTTARGPTLWVTHPHPGTALVRHIERPLAVVRPEMTARAWPPLLSAGL